MCTQHTPEEMMMLTTGDASPLRAWVLRRHLRRCDSCRTEWTRTQALWAQAKAVQGMPVPSRVYERISAAREEPNPISPPRLSRTILWRPAAALAAGIAAAVAAALLLPGQPAHPTPTFADVQKAMAQVKIMYYQTAWTQYYKEGPLKGHLKLRQIRARWDQINPPAFSTIPVQAPLWYPHAPAWSRFIGTQTGTGTLDTHNHTFVVQVGKVYQVTQAQEKQTITDFSTAPGYSYPFVYSGLIRFHSKPMLKYVWLSPTGDPSKREIIIDTTKVTLLADAQTKRVCYVDEENMWNGHVSDSLVRSHFRYNQTPPPGTFAFAYPGVRVKVIK